MSAELLAVDLGRGLRLVLIPSVDSNIAGFPTDSIAKAPVLAMAEVELAEEGVGFGLPVLRARFDTIFPGSVTLVDRTKEGSSFALEFDMNLVERLEKRGSPAVATMGINLIKEFFAWLHRKLPFTREALSLVSELLRPILGLRTVFEPRPSVGKIRVKYRVDAGSGMIGIRAEAGALDVDGAVRMVLMNEAGARHFDRYEDSGGTLLNGPQIETWRRVDADWAAFKDSASGVYFAARLVPGSTLYRGRELVGRRLSWSGLAFVLPPGRREFEYRIEAGAAR